MKKFLPLIALLLGACAQMSEPVVGLGNPEKIPLKSSLVHIHWTSPSEINDKCESLGVEPGGRIMACAAVRYKAEDRSSICDLYAVQPESFYDKEQLAYLGHEAWHCFGAIHSPSRAKALQRTKQIVESLNRKEAQAAPNKSN